MPHFRGGRYRTEGRKVPYPHFLGQIKRFWGFLGPGDQNETDISVVFIDDPPEVNSHFHFL